MTSTPAAVAPADAARVRSLDGLRGVAALVVVVHHALQVDPVLARVQAAESAAGESGLVWALTHTPLHLLWAGEEAVLVFFVLSGFVLTLPATRRSVRWREYYPRRLVRLYLPVWGSLLLAVAVKAVLPSADGPGHSAWVSERAAVRLDEVWHDAPLVAGTGLLNSPLWSLRWEVLFSLALPLYVLALRRRSGRRAWLDVAVLVSLIGAGTLVGSPWLRYLPVFGLGVVLAFHHDRLAAPPPPRPRGPPGGAEGDATRGGATGWLFSQAPIQGGETFTLDLMIWDVGDGVLDSSVLIDNFRWALGEVTTTTDRPVDVK